MEVLAEMAAELLHRFWGSDNGHVDSVIEEFLRTALTPSAG